VLGVLPGCFVAEQKVATDRAVPFPRTPAHPHRSPLASYFAGRNNKGCPTVHVPTSLSEKGDKGIALVLI
jgi:hypothetical protein